MSTIHLPTAAVKPTKKMPAHERDTLLAPRCTSVAIQHPPCRFFLVSVLPKHLFLFHLLAKKRKLSPVPSPPLQHPSPSFITNNMFLLVRYYYCTTSSTPGSQPQLSTNPRTQTTTDCCGRLDRSIYRRAEATNPEQKRREKKNTAPNGRSFYIAFVHPSIHVFVFFSLIITSAHSWLRRVKATPTKTTKTSVCLPRAERTKNDGCALSAECPTIPLGSLSTVVVPTQDSTKKNLLGLTCGKNSRDERKDRLSKSAQQKKRQKRQKKYKYTLTKKHAHTQTPIAKHKKHAQKPPSNFFFLISPRVRQHLGHLEKKPPLYRLPFFYCMRPYIFLFVCCEFNVSVKKGSHFFFFRF